MSVETVSSIYTKDLQKNRRRAVINYLNSAVRGRLGPRAASEYYQAYPVGPKEILRAVTEGKCTDLAEEFLRLVMSEMTFEIRTILLLRFHTTDQYSDKINRSSIARMDGPFISNPRWFNHTGAIILTLDDKWHYLTSGNYQWSGNVNPGLTHLIDTSFDGLVAQIVQTEFCPNFRSLVLKFYN